MFEGSAIGMSSIIANISVRVNRVVIDRTGLQGAYDIELHWSPESADGPSIFTAIQEQLGLKVESTRGPAPVLVIDHIERLTPD